MSRNKWILVAVGPTKFNFHRELLSQLKAQAKANRIAEGFLEGRERVAVQIIA